ncbi:helix-turn-helix domain-containing protein [Candidatus Amarolinea aalborgensis]|uniref:helix-turn-helix domain-containing protein n=1 Tax=Candidatus Amarolinea aalborgensis TaxID=2249329 RepID=UPI003BF985D8
MEDLWKVRRRKRMTVGELSSRTGISSKVLQRYELGETPIPLEDIERLARALYVEPWEIKIQSDPPPSPPPGETNTPRPAPTSAPPRSTAPAPQTHAGPGADSIAPYSAPMGGQRPAYSRPPGPPRSEPGPRPGPEGGAPRYSAPDRRLPRRERPERPDRERRAPPVPGPVRASQVAHLVNLGKRLGVEQADLEAQAGKPLSELNRREASQLLGTLQKRIVEEHPSRPKGKRQRPYLPESVDEFEFRYLTAVQEEQRQLDFKLFDGSQIVGQVIGFSPYAITIREASGAETTVQKLAIAYYRHSPQKAAL